MLGYLAVIVAAPQPPLTVDYPDWVYQGVLLHGVLTGHPVAGYALKTYPIPNSLTTVALGLADAVLPWAWAAKLWLCCYLLLALAACRSLSRASGAADWRMIVVLPAVALLNLDFWWGHVSFEIGLCLLLLLLAQLLKGRSAATLALLLVLLFFTHMEACACAMLLLGLWTLRDRQWHRLWALAPVLLLTAWYTLGRYHAGNVDEVLVPHAAFGWGSRKFLIFKANTFFKVFGYVDAHSVERRSITEAIFGRTLLLVLLVLGCVLALLCLWLALACERQGWRSTARWFCLCLVGLAAVLPQQALGVADPGSRLLLVGVVIAFFAARWRSPQGTVAAAIGIVLTVANLVQFARIQAKPGQPGARPDLPPALLRFAHVDPAERVQLYRTLQTGPMSERIFETGLFQMTKP